MTSFVANSVPTLSKLIGDLREGFKRAKYVRGNWQTGRDRSLDQNAISHAWYEQVAAELREDDALGVKRFCKLHFGVPILRVADDDFREVYDTSIKTHLNYEQKLKAMDILPITSLMTVPQMSAYLTEVQSYYSGQGVYLEFPPEDKPVKRTRSTKTVERRDEHSGL